MKTSIDDIVALNPRGIALRSAVLASLEERPTRTLLSTGLSIVDNSTATLCACYCQTSRAKSTYVRSVVRNDLFTAVAIWLEILKARFPETSTYEDMCACSDLLLEIWEAIVVEIERPVDDVVAMLIAGQVLGAGLREAYEGKPLLGSVDLDVVVQSQVFASLRRCVNLREIVDVARSQLLPASSSK